MGSLRLPDTSASNFIQFFEICFQNKLHKLSYTFHSFCLACWAGASGVKLDSLLEHLYLLPFQDFPGQTRSRKIDRNLSAYALGLPVYTTSTLASLFLHHLSFSGGCAARLFFVSLLGGRKHPSRHPRAPHSSTCIPAQLRPVPAGTDIHPFSSSHLATTKSIHSPGLPLNPPTCCRGT